MCDVLIGICSDLVVTFLDRKSTRLNSSHLVISYAVFCLKKKINLRSYIPERQRAAERSRAHARLIDDCSTIRTPSCRKYLADPPPVVGEGLIAVVLRSHT